MLSQFAMFYLDTEAFCHNSWSWTEGSIGNSYVRIMHKFWVGKSERAWKKQNVARNQRDVGNVNDLDKTLSDNNHPNPGRVALPTLPVRPLQRCQYVSSSQGRTWLSYFDTLDSHISRPSLYPWWKIMEGGQKTGVLIQYAPVGTSKESNPRKVHTQVH